MKIILRIQGAEESRIQVTCLRLPVRVRTQTGATHRQEGMEDKPLDPSNPGILEPYFLKKGL